jgi:hypothetical protein
MSYQTDLEETHIEMRSYVQQYFQKLSFEVMNHIHVKKYIINQVIRSYWHQLLEDFFKLITSKNFKSISDSNLDKIKIFNEQYERYRDAKENAKFLNTRAGKIFNTIKQNIHVIFLDVILKLQINNLIANYTKLQLSKCISSIRKHLLRLYIDNVMEVLFTKPDKNKNDKNGNTITDLQNDDGDDDNNKDDDDDDDNNKDDDDDNNKDDDEESESDDNKDDKNDDKDDKNDDKDDKDDKDDDDKDDGNSNNDDTDDDDSEIIVKDDYTTILKNETFEVFFPSFANILQTENSKTFKKVSIPISNNVNISVSHESLPVLYTKYNVCYDHIFELVGGGSHGFAGYRLFDETLAFIYYNKNVLSQLKSFTYLEFDKGKVSSDFNKKVLKVLNQQINTKTDSKFIIKQIPASYGNKDDKHRNVVSFVRDGRKNNIDYQSMFKLALAIPFLKDKKYEEVLNLDSIGHPLPPEKIFNMLDQVKLKKGEKVFDVGIGCLQLAIYASYITETNVDGNDNNEDLLNQISKTWN